MLVKRVPLLRMSKLRYLEGGNIAQYGDCEVDYYKFILIT